MAARVQASGRARHPFVVNGGDAAARSPGCSSLEERGPQTLKGVREPVVLYRVVQPSGVRSRLAVAAGRLTPFVGREVELATLVERWERAQDGEGQNVLVVGEAGVGKSRLVYQLRERLAGSAAYLARVRRGAVHCGHAVSSGDRARHAGLWRSRPTTRAPISSARSNAGCAALASSRDGGARRGLPRAAGPMPLAMHPDLQRRKTLELLAQWSLALVWCSRSWC